jgi:glycosyltransferase involved in cell wall biosynthesis
MLNNKKIVVVLPAYNAEKTLNTTYDDIPKDIVDEIVMVDDYSRDRTVEVARSLGMRVFVHDKNMGYGANQKTCYREALSLGADVIIMLHPDYQYPPKLITAMAAPIAAGVFDIMLGSRILCNNAVKGGMPLYKYFANRILTLVENAILRCKLSEYHTGYRAFSKEVLRFLPILENSDDFIFDNEILTQALYFGYNIGELSAPSQYTKDSSSINFRRSVVYGISVLITAFKYFLQKHSIARFRIFDSNGEKIPS